NPEGDPKRLAGEFLEIGPGVNFQLPCFGEPRFGVEMTWPFYQTLDGPQLERDWQLTAGWQWAF
ncbi:MAG: transporter, partial [Myxococcota bacterium]